MDGKRLFVADEWGSQATERKMSGKMIKWFLGDMRVI
jgi:hypothetical protein